MSTPVDLAPRPSPLHAPELDQELDLDLAELLELFGWDDVVASASARPSRRHSGARLRTWAQTSSRRAAAWGAVPLPVAVRSSVGTEGPR